MPSATSTLNRSTRLPSRTWATIWKVSTRSRSMLLWVTEVLAVLRLVSWIQWPPLTTQPGDMVSVTTTVSSSNSSRMVLKSKSLIIGSATVTLGKSNVSMSNTKFISTAKSERLPMLKELNVPFGKIARPSSLELTIPPFLAMLPSTRSLSGYGNLFLSMNSISILSTKENTTMPWRPDSVLSTLLVSCTPMIQLRLEKSWGSNSSICWFQLPFKISWGGINPMQKKLVASSFGKTSRKRPAFNWTTLIQLWELSNFWEFWSTKSTSTKRRLGRSFTILFPTPTIRCCLRPWRNGVCSYWESSFLAICSWSTSLTSSGWTRSAKNTPTTGTSSILFLWLRSPYPKGS